MNEQLFTPIPVGEIQTGDRFNTFQRMKGQIRIDWGRVAGRIIRDNGRLWWVMTESGPVAPDLIQAVWRPKSDYPGGDSESFGFARVEASPSGQIRGDEAQP
jgi:hypothetical protein